MGAKPWNPSPERQRAMLADVEARMALKYMYGWNGETQRFEVYKPAIEGGAVVCSYDATQDRERAHDLAAATAEELNGRKAHNPRQLALI
jgi:hypothetical protein